MSLRTVIIAVVASIAAAAFGCLLKTSDANAQPNADRGHALYENHCQFCHTPQIHSRAKKHPLTRAELRDIVNHWRRQQDLRWTDQDTEDVVEYLSRTRYRFPPSGA